jgi:hypothetical protein
MFRIVTIALVAALLSACATPKRPATLTLPEDNRANELLIAIPQQEITVDKPDVNAGGGLLGALVEGIAESTMDKNRQEALAPLRDALADYDFDAKFQSAITGALPAAYFVDAPQTTLIRNTDDWLQAHVERNGRTFGSVNVAYAFAPNFQMLYIRAYLDVGDIGLVLDRNGKPKAKYTSDEARAGKLQGMTYYAMFPLENPGSFKENVPRWVADGGRLAREALDAGIAEIADLVRRDFASPLPVNESNKQNFLVPTGSALLNMKGGLVETRGGRRLLASGSLVAWTAIDEAR